MKKKQSGLIATERLLLRRKEEKDIPALLAMLRDRETTQYLGGYPPDSERAVARMVASDRTTSWAMALRETDEMIGEVAFQTITDHYLGEVSYLVRRDYWGCGYAREAMEALLAYGADTLGLGRFCASIDNRNSRSKTLVERLGFTLVALLPEYNFGGRVADVAYYSRPATKQDGSVI